MNKTDVLIVNSPLFEDKVASSQQSLAEDCGVLCLFCLFLDPRYPAS
jgi:hypothetical protein